MFASRQEDKARPAYGHYVVVRPRRLVRRGTQPTQSRYPAVANRQPPLLADRAAAADRYHIRLAEMRLQLWGEGARRQAGGESLFLPEELWLAAGAEQEKRRLEHGWESASGSLRPRTCWSISTGAQPLCAASAVELRQHRRCVRQGARHPGVEDAPNDRSSWWIRCVPSAGRSAGSLERSEGVRVDTADEVSALRTTKTRRATV